MGVVGCAALLSTFAAILDMAVSKRYPARQTVNDFSFTVPPRCGEPDNPPPWVFEVPLQVVARPDLSNPDADDQRRLLQEPVL